MQTSDTRIDSMDAIRNLALYSALLICHNAFPGRRSIHENVSVPCRWSVASRHPSVSVGFSGMAAGDLLQALL